MYLGNSGEGGKKQIKPEIITQAEFCVVRWWRCQYTSSSSQGHAL